jgi:hypothetical protein
MADSENTAVNDLIARAGGQTPDSGDDDVGHEMGVETIPVGQLRAAARVSHERGTETIPVGPARARGAIDPMHTTLPASMPVAAPFETRSAAMQSTYPTPARAEPDRPRRLFGGNGEHLVGTLQLARRRPGSRDVVGKLLVPVALLVLAGVLIGAFIALRGPSPAPVARAVPPTTASAAAPAPTAAPIAAPAPAPTVAAAPTAAPIAAAPAPTAAPIAAPAPTGAPTAAPAEAGAPAALVDVRIDSTPAGATVTLVDRGKPQIVGETPISAAIDPSREYDLVLTYAGKPTRTVHLDPRTTRRIAFAFDAPAAAPARPEPVRREPVRREPPRRAEPAKRDPAPAKPAGEGTLMISSKPPCEITIDGKATGLTTPQRAIALSAGRHKVTLINAEKDIRKTLTVEIAADETAKIIEDLMP